MPIFLQNAEFTFFSKTAILPMLYHAAELVVISNDVDIEARAIVIKLDQIEVVQLFCDLTKCQPYQLSDACFAGFLSITEIIMTCPTVGITEINW